MMIESNWNEILKSLPNNHILQTEEWGIVKNLYGWQTEQKTWQDPNNNIFAAAQILTRTINFRGKYLPFRVSYIPRGPVLDWNNIPQSKEVIIDIENLAKHSGAIFTKIDPELVIGQGIPNTPEEIINTSAKEILSFLDKRGWKYSNEQIQFRNTVLLNVDASDDDLLARMKQKTRYNIRLAQRKGVSTRSVDRSDFPLLYKMYAETSLRDGFAIRSQDYYYDVWNTFFDSQMAEGILAEVNGDPVAGLFIFYFDKRAWYLYGMSTQKHREKMPNYLLQWDAIKAARFRSCTQYDLWGAPDIFDETDSMWGVFRFKDGLGGKVIRTPGAWDFPVRPNLYSLYINILPRILAILRARGKKQTRSITGLN